jgi:ketosteroid isomerase-like protein
MCLKNVKRKSTMKKKLLSSILLFTFFYALAQDDIKTEINSLEQKSRRAIVEKDTATLHKLWSPNFMVNAPTNTVLKGGQVQMVTGGIVSYTSYTGELEEILINGDIVITMGHESVVAAMGNANGGQTIQRRYTHVWKKQEKSWLLIARHSSVICHP